MQVKQLRQLLERLPPEQEICFSIWDRCGYTHYRPQFMMKDGGDVVAGTFAVGDAVSVLHADNCLAHIIGEP